MNKFTFLCGIAVMVANTTAHAQTNTRSITNMFPAGYKFRVLENDSPSKTTLGKFVREMGNPDPFINHLGSPTRYNFAISYQQKGYQYLDDVELAGQRAFEQSATYGLREVAVSYLPIGQYELGAENIGLWFVHGAIGNTAEEQSELVTPIPSASEVSWWNRARQDHLYDFGIRLFNTRPYVYGRLRLGHFENRPFATVSGRWYYDPRRNTDEIKIESVFAMPYDLGLAMGASVDPLRAGDNNSFSFRLQHITHNEILKAWSIGLVQNHSTTIVFQLDLPWPEKH